MTILNTQIQASKRDKQFIHTSHNQYIINNY